MSDIYSNNLSRQDIQRIAEELILKHGDGALAEAEKEISTSNARGNFTLSGSWVLVCQRIRQMQIVDDFDGAGNDNHRLLL